jgi:hypothetical protein
MARVRIALLLCVALLTSVAAQAAEAAIERGSTTTVSGVYSVLFYVKLLTTLPAGSTITCRARIAPSPGSPELLRPQLVAFPVAAEVVAVNGPTASCSTEIPFSWTVTGAPAGITLSYEIEAVSRSGVQQSSTRQQIGAEFPAWGGSARLSLEVVF